MTRPLLNGKVCNLNQLNTFTQNVRNGSVDAFLNGKNLEYYDRFYKRWTQSSQPHFDTFEYRVKVIQYQPLTPQEASEYLDKKIKCQGVNYKLVNIGLDDVTLQNTETSFKFVVDYAELANCSFDGKFLRKEKT